MTAIDAATDASPTEDPVLVAADLDELAGQDATGISDASLRNAQARSDALAAAIDDPGNPRHASVRMLTGDRPTGPLHIAHYLASLKNRVRLQDKGITTFVLIADYQVITDRDSVGEIEANTLGAVADYLAAGIDPNRSTIFTHSAVPALNQLLLPFLSLVSVAELERNPTVKDELAATDGRPMSGLLLTYPVHQAADILFCKGNCVPVGKDQLPHLEMTRVIARRFNNRYGSGRAIFPEPDALLAQVPLLLGLDGTKMSKSRGNTINLRHTADETAAMVKKAKTDAERRITFDPQNRPEVSNLLTIAGMFSDRDPRELAEQIGDGGGAVLKQLVTDSINEGLREHRRRRVEIAADPGHLRSVLRAGNERANVVAEATLDEVRQAMGMTY